MRNKNSLIVGGITMKLKKIIALAFLVLLMYGGNAFCQGFESFSAESKNVTKELRCHDSKITPASNEFGALYGCIQGSAKTVKWFINEIPNTNRVKNVKLMWNDWFKDRGYGIHADKSNAQKALTVLIKLYAPQQGKEIEKAFWGKNERAIETKNFVLKYSYYRGPAIDERLIIVTEK